MPPRNSDNQPRPSLDGVRRPHSTHIKPDYRPDHELPAPEPTPLLEKPKTPDTPVDAKPVDVPAAKDGVVSSLSQKLPLAKKWRLPAFIGLGALALLLGSFIWYQIELLPVSGDKDKTVKVVIKPGTSPGNIAKQLKSAQVIRSEVAFTIHTKLTGTENNLKAGLFDLKPSQSTPTIVDALVKGGSEDTFQVTFLPGDTLANAKKRLLKLGVFSATDIDAAFNKQYDRPLFASKPASADLEGYLFGETLEFNAAATVETVLDKFFDHYEEVIEKNNLVEGFKKQGLSLYEGITLASIVQREVSSTNPNVASEDQRNVARVFYNRMAKGMTLGSDVTYQYIADKTGVARDPNLDSPYNTRRYAGLPPGPIATPGVGALLAVANPASNDYLFFLSGDDDVTYFAKTDAQHQQNIVNHCKKKCTIL